MIRNRKSNSAVTQTVDASLVALAPGIQYKSYCSASDGKKVEGLTFLVADGFRVLVRLRENKKFSIIISL